MNTFKEHFYKLANIGKVEDKGVTRLLFSKEYKEAMALLLQYFNEAGLESYVDSVENVHGILKSEQKGAKTMFLGSHLDTVNEGGMYDGLLGVMVALETVKYLRDNNIKLKHNLHIIATNGEEGNDLGGTFGSRCMMGMIDVDQAGYLDIAKGFALTREDILGAICDTEDAACFLELHIEQGLTLEKTDLEIGVVTGIVGLRRYGITVVGEANHAGTTMMQYRKDALVAAAILVKKINEKAIEFGDSFVATVGKFQIFPNSVAVIPAKVEMVLEFRHRDSSKMDDFFSEISAYIQTVEDAHISITPIVDKAPVVCDEKIIETVDTLCREKNIPYMQMPSGATHDGNAFAYKMPIGMIFVPSRGGISHNKDEHTDWKYIEQGCKLYIDSVIALDKIL